MGTSKSRHFLVSGVFVALAAFAAQAEAGTIYSASGNTNNPDARPISATAEFTFGLGTSGDVVEIVLTNTTAHMVSVGELLTGLEFQFVPPTGTTSLTYAHADVVHSVAANGTYTAISDVDLLNAPRTKNGTTTYGPTWEVASGSSLLLKWKPDPNYGILGSRESDGTYSQANSSIAGNGPHNPFVAQTAVFRLQASGLTATSSVRNVVFAFGTGMESRISPPVVPLPSSAWAGLGLLGALGVVRVMRRRRDLD